MVARPRDPSDDARRDQLGHPQPDAEPAETPGDIVWTRRCAPALGFTALLAAPLTYGFFCVPVSAMQISFVVLLRQHLAAREVEHGTGDTGMLPMTGRFRISCSRPGAFCWRSSNGGFCPRFLGFSMVVWFGMSSPSECNGSSGKPLSGN
jgi:hypothetical protein